MRIFPQSFIQGLFLSLKDLYIFLAVVATFLSILALKSYYIFDNSLNVASLQLTKNWLGWGGAYFADACFQALGKFAYVVPVIFGLCAIRAVMSYLERPFSNSFILFFLGLPQLLLACTYYQAFFTGSGRLLGGAFGLVLLRNFENFLSIYQIKEWADECVFLFSVCGIFCTVMGIGITQSHLRDMKNFFYRCIQWINGRMAEKNNNTPIRQINIQQNGKDDINTKTVPLSQPTFVQSNLPLKNTGLENDHLKVLNKKASKMRSTRADGYVLPSIELLDDTQQKKIVQDSDLLQQQAAQLMDVLQEFGIDGEIASIRSGPVVTMYELKPAAGIKTSRVIGLADDIARSMSAISARIATVPGQNVIGIELPNPKRQTVYMRDLLLQNEFKNTAAALPLILGQDIVGVPIIADLARMPHLLVAGTTGSGKSVSVNAMILSILFRLSPEECRFIMIDPKMLELSVYNNIPHLLTPVVTEPKKAIVALKWAVKEMEIRYRNMSRLGVRNIDGYNARLKDAKEKGEIISRRVQTGFDPDTGQAIFENQVLDLKPLPYIIVVIDEMADLMIVAGKEVEAAVQRLAQMARAAGIHMIMATQRPSVDVITGTIKANFPTRISFQVTSKIDSRTILGEQGAEQLLGQGDMLYMSGAGRVMRVHGPFIKDSEVESVVAFLKEYGEPSYVQAVTIDTDDTFSASEGGEESNDPLFNQAVELIKRENKISTSFIQRHFQIGYNKAARIVEQMEKQGIVSAANHQGKREILVS